MAGSLRASYFWIDRVINGLKNPAAPKAFEALVVSTPMPPADPPVRMGTWCAIGRH